MALSATLVWAMDAAGDGHADNGGGWNTAGTGSDKSTAAAVVRTDIVIAATTTNITSAATPFAASDVGNVIKLVSGGSATPGYYEIVSHNPTGNVATLDRSAGTASSGITGRLGGPISSANNLITSTGTIVPGNKVWIKGGTNYALTGAMSLPTGATATTPIILEGFTTTRGDGGQATFATAGSYYGFNMTGAHIRFRNLIVDATTGGTANGFSLGSGAGNILENCKAIQFATSGFTTTGVVTFLRCVAGPGKGTPTAGFDLGNNCMVIGCVADGPNTGTTITYPGFRANASSPPTMIHCVSRNHVGTSGHGFNAASGTSGMRCINCVAYNNGATGFRLNAAGSETATVLINCISSDNSVGFFSSNTIIDTPIKYNAIYNNATDYTGLTAPSTDIDLTATPFVSAATGDFNANTSDPGGADIRGMGYPNGAYPTITSTVGYGDIGLPHQAVDPASSNLNLSQDINGTSLLTILERIDADITSRVAAGSTVDANIVEVLGEAFVPDAAVELDLTTPLDTTPVAGSVGEALYFADIRLDAAVSSRLATAGYTAPPTAAANADAVWDEARSGHVAAGSFGEGVASVQGNVTGSVASVTAMVTANVTQLSGDATAADNAEAFFDGTGYAGTGNTIPTVGTVTGSVGSVTGAVGSVTGLVTANVTQISGDATAADNAESFFDGTGYAGTGNTIPNVTTVGSVTGAVGSVTGAVGSVTAAVTLTMGQTLPATPTADTVGEALKFASSRIDAAITTRAPSSTALSTAQWTNARATAIDNLDAAVTTRAAAATALSTAQWTNARATNLDNLDMAITAVPTAQEIEDEILDALIADHLDIGSVGEAINEGGTVEGATDWTTTERAQIRHRFGIDGTKATPSSSPELGTVAANVIQIQGGTQTVVDLKDFADTGYDPVTHKVAGVVTTDAVTSATLNMSQALPASPTADTVGESLKFASTRLDAAITTRHIAGAAVSAVTGNVGGNVAGSVASVTSPVSIASASRAVLVDEVWDELLADHQDVGSTGEGVYLASTAAGGGSTDWTTTERAQIRYWLGIDGAASAPASAVPNLDLTLDMGQALPVNPTADTVGEALKNAASYVDVAISSRVEAGTTIDSNLVEVLGEAFIPDANVNLNMSQALPSTPVAGSVGEALKFADTRLDATTSSLATLITTVDTVVDGIAVNVNPARQVTLRSQQTVVNPTADDCLSAAHVTAFGDRTISGTSYVKKHSDGTTAITQTLDNAEDPSSVTTP